MRFHILSCAIALGLALGAGEAAVAQVRGPPPNAQVDSVGDVARQDSLSQRLATLQAKLAKRSDGEGARMLSQTKALAAKVRDASLSDGELNDIEAVIQRLENGARS
jgi:hypothetical protein